MEVKGFEQSEFDSWSKALEMAGARMVADMAEDGAKIARELAPVGVKADPRTKRIVDSIVSYATRTSAHWGVVGTRHGMIIEKGGGPALIPGNVSFWWEKEGRRWLPGDNVIHHPPTAAKPYLQPSFDTVMSNWLQYARRYYTF